MKKDFLSDNQIRLIFCHHGYRIKAQRAVREIKQVIYVDVLVCLNTIISFFMLGAVRLICREKTKPWRILTGSFMGGAYSLCIFLPELPTAVSIAIRTFFLLAVTLCVFGFGFKKRFLRLFACLCAVSFLFAGAVVGVWLVFRPQGLVIRNSGLYLDIGFLPLVLFSAAVYVAVTVFMRFFSRNTRDNCACTVLLKCNGKTLSLKGIIDTGNTLTDSFTGKSISVVDRATAFLLFDEKTSECFLSGNIPEGMHLTVSSTVGGEGLLPVFTAEQMSVTTDAGSAEIQTPALAVSQTESFTDGVSVLVNSDIFNLIKETRGGEHNAEKADSENKNIITRKKENRSLLHKRSADPSSTVDAGQGKRNNAKN